MFDLHPIVSAFITSWQLWLVVFVITIAIITAATLFPIKKALEEYAYKRKTSIMTQSEQKLFTLLVELLGTRYYVFPQVHLDAILNYKVPGQNWFGAFKHINEKSVDFVICDKTQEEPLFAIELDDESHRREDRIERDTVVNNIFKNTSFPLLRINTRDASDRQLVEQKVSRLLDNRGRSYHDEANTNTAILST